MMRREDFRDESTAYVKSKKSIIEGFESSLDL